MEIMMKAACKIWLRKKNEKVFGQGPCELLKQVEKTDSLHEAARQIGMSYNKAWRLIRLMEKRLGFPLLEKQVGGQSGGGSQVTPGAKDLIERYERFETDAMKAIEKAYEKHFGHQPGKRGGR
jgi:molybdate transport system regulatory protein